MHFKHHLTLNALSGLKFFHRNLHKPSRIAGTAFFIINFLERAVILYSAAVVTPFSGNNYTGRAFVYAIRAVYTQIQTKEDSLQRQQLYWSRLCLRYSV